MGYRDRSNIRKKYIAAVVIFLIAALLLGFLIDLAITRVEYSVYKKPEEYEDIIENYSEKYDVPEHIIYAVIKAESGFDHSARSGAGAIGLMQLMPSTFEELTDTHLKEYLDTSTLYDPETNIRYGTYYLSYLYEIYGDWTLVFAAYNAGMGNVNSWLDNKNYSTDGKQLKKIPVRETRKYVSRVESNLEKYNELYK